MHAKTHWEDVYATRPADRVSWFQAHADRSLRLIREAGTPAEAAIIDVGGGASVLVDGLLAGGYRNVTVLDLSGHALAVAKGRLGRRAADVAWLEGDVLETELPRHAYDLWHDRAVFHFMTTPAQRQAYVRAVLHAVKPGGSVIVATFAEDGPTQCSGLPVRRYGARELHAEFGEPFVLVGHERETHRTPAGAGQSFVYCLCRKETS